MVQFVHGELSYRIIGLLYKIYNAMGPGFQEKYYQSAIRKVFEKERIPFLEQVRMDINIAGENIGRYYIDFVVDHKIALEIKSKTFFSQKDIRQILGYLKKSGLEVGLLVGFSSEGLKIKRLLRGFPGKKLNDIQRNPVTIPGINPGCTLYPVRSWENQNPGTRSWENGISDS